MDYRDPANRREFRDDVRKEKFQRSGFATGFDMFSEEEIKKRRQRAEKFGISSSGGLDWQPPEVPQEEQLRRQRAERFGVDYQPPDETGLMDVDLYEERKDAPVEVERRPNAIHVYGVDLLSTSDILKYFADYGPTYVEWINDSSANVLFGDEGTAARALVGLGKPLPPDQQLIQGAISSHSMAYLWHKGLDFVKSGSNIPLIFRVATVLDVKPATGVQSRRLWVNAGGGSRQNPTSGRRWEGKRPPAHGGTGGRWGVRKPDRRNKRRDPYNAAEQFLSGLVDDDGMIDVGPIRGRGSQRYVPTMPAVAPDADRVKETADDPPPRDLVDYNDL